MFSPTRWHQLNDLRALKAEDFASSLAMEERTRKIAILFGIIPNLE